jgi:hypothetical protein
MASVRYTIDEDALRLAEMMDGKLLVVTNVQDMAPSGFYAVNRVIRRRWRRPRPGRRACRGRR